MLDEKVNRLFFVGFINIELNFFDDTSLLNNREKYSF